MRRINNADSQTGTSLKSA